MRTFIAITALFAATITADAAHWVRANVYFRGWYSERYVAVSPEGLREEALHGSSRLVHINSGAQLQQLLAMLDLPHLHALRGDTRSDTELVVDLFDSSGGRTTYRGDNRYLWSSDCTRAREVDEHFRKFFEQLTANRPNQALERTADRREDLFSMSSPLNPAAQLALVSGRSVCSR
jgi:hypothetical protein